MSLATRTYGPDHDGWRCLSGLSNDSLDWELEDPAGKDVDAVRPIRDEIRRRVRGLLEDLGVPAGQ